MSRCFACQHDRHPHDRWTETGLDAGCPNVTADGHECDCDFVVPPRPNAGRCPTCGHVQ